MKKWLHSKLHPEMDFNCRRMVIVGWWLIIIPLCEVVFDRLFASFSDSWQFQIHKLLYVILIGLSFRLWGRVDSNIAPANIAQPLLNFNAIFWQSFTLLTGALVFGNQAGLILPLAYIWVGISFYLWGQLLVAKLRYVGWAYIASGLLTLMLNSHSSYSWWRIEIIAFGLSYLMLGRWCHRYLGKYARFIK